MKKQNSPKIAVVTGGSSGIGKAIAEKLHEEGITVVVADITEGENKQGILFKKCDVSKGAEIDELYTWVLDNLGKPTILILNAGQGIREKLTEGDPEKWQQILHTNLMGPLRAVRSFVPDMLEMKKGNVVFISSVSANQPHPYGGIYSASKSALEVVAETLRLETIPHVNVTVVSPGVVDTSFFKNEMSGDSNIDEMGMGSISPKEIAEDVWYALNKKSGTSINKIITRPTLQNF
ncbi:putative oxidoreductase [Salinimicrobium marinum]|uniref:Oxidoreductase n=1 Tax=Salinimicrobium marinum TaxID=680283 RepID=A0A918W0M8_9FLAO|nr:SDR family oxidoreductase [Salinimicrobium marinum]GHA45523.1 putative oxidoreductase [Salinimicrobium marinum]